MTQIIIFLIVLFLVLFFVAKDWKTIAKVMSGWAVMELFNFFLDFPVWMWFQVHFGLIRGSIYISTCAFVFNFGLLIWYQWCGEDWLGVNILEKVKKEEKEWAKKINNYKNKSWFLKIVLFLPVYVPYQTFRLVIWSLNKTDLTTFLVFSIFQDSFVTTVFLRHGRFGKLDWRDIKIFVASTILSCFTWSLFDGSLLKGGEFIWHIGRLLFG